MTISTWNITCVPESEYIERRNRLWNEISNKYTIDAIVIYDQMTIRYLCGAITLQLERPMSLTLRSDGYSEIMVPRLDYEYVQETAKKIDNFVYYGDNPGKKTPVEFLADRLRGMGLAGTTVLEEHETPPWIFGYRGPRLEDIMGDTRFIIDPYIIYNLRVHKSEFDLKCIRETARWGNAALSELVKLTKPGVYDTEIAVQASAKATEAMKNALGPQFDTRIIGINSTCHASARYAGQVGTKTAKPHAYNAYEKPIPKNSIVISGGDGALLMYCSELERTFFVGEPSKEFRKYYTMAAECEMYVIRNIHPGMTCADVDNLTHKYYEENGLLNFWRHHTGHGLGFEGHEWPYLDEGQDDVVLEAGMVFSVEPGFYVDGVGGFRLSDTIAVTEEGIELITYYPRDLESIIIS